MSSPIYTIYILYDTFWEIMEFVVDFLWQLNVKMVKVFVHHREPYDTNSLNGVITIEE